MPERSAIGFLRLFHLAEQVGRCPLHLGLLRRAQVQALCDGIKRS